MTTAKIESLSALYEQDETAWLDVMADLLRHGQYAQLDHRNLRDYLSDMAKRDRREVYSRLVVLMSHLLKWQYQPERQSGSWRATIREQRLELRLLLESPTLKNHACAVLADAYADAGKSAADETEMEFGKFPEALAWEIEEILSED